MDDVQKVEVVKGVGNGLEYRTAVAIKQLQHVITPKRFRELTGGVPLEDLSQAVAAPIAAHLRHLSDYYADFNNILIAWHEGFSHPGINPRGQASVVPQLMDRLSREMWES